MARTSKKDEFWRLYNQGRVGVTFDPRQDGVVVPKHFKTASSMTLVLSEKMLLDDLKVGDLVFQVTLSFAKSPFLCTIPWAAVFSMSLDDVPVTLWPNSLPADAGGKIQKVEMGLADPEGGIEVVQLSPASAPKSVSAPARMGASTWRRPQAEQSAQAALAPTAPRGHLRVVRDEEPVGNDEGGPSAA